MKVNNSKGQSLLELVIGLGLLTVVITVLTITTIGGLRNSQFSKNQTQATKLAQEGLEKVRAIRDRNYAVCGPNNITNWSSIYTLNCSQTCPYILKTGAPSCGSVSADFWLSYSAVPEAIMADGVNFNRLVSVKDFGNPSDITQKEITVTVSWTDLSGTHSSKLTTILAQDI